MISLRFDDCSRSQYDIGFKLFKKKNIKAVMFPIGNTILSSTETYEIAYTTLKHSNNHHIKLNELIEMQNNGIEIGYHSLSHRHLLELNEKEWEKEINSDLIKSLGLNIKSFCIPYSNGSNNEKLINFIKNKMKYESICGIPSDKTIEIGKKSDIFYSLTINKYTSIENLEKKIDYIIKNNHYLILCFHGITGGPIQVNDCSSVQLEKFEKIIDLIVKKKKEGLIDITFHEYNKLYNIKYRVYEQY